MTIVIWKSSVLGYVHVTKAFFIFPAYFIPLTNRREKIFNLFYSHNCVLNQIVMIQYHI